MKILQVSRHHWEYSVGGVEKYLHDLTENITLYTEHQCKIVTFQKKNRLKISDSELNGITTFKLPLVEESSEEELLTIFEDIIKNELFDIVQFHFFRLEEYLCSTVCKKMGIPYLFIYHLPAASCLRGNLRRWGQTVCDGKVETKKCASCRIQNKLKTPISISYAIALILKTLNNTQGIQNYWYLTKRYVENFEKFISNAHAIICCSQWSIDLFLKNNINFTKIHFLPQGINNSFGSEPPRLFDKRQSTLTIGYVGRLSPEKGLDVFLKAFISSRSLNFNLYIIGGNVYNLSKYEKYIYKLAESDQNRIRIVPQIEQKLLIEYYKIFDYIVIPSVGPETGPFVFLEALKFGIPILASDLIGHKSMLQGNNCGIIVSPSTVKQWRLTLNTIAKSTQNFDKCQTKIPTMKEISMNLVDIYKHYSIGVSSGKTDCSTQRI